jgi:hypothetical protein
MMPDLFSALVFGAAGTVFPVWRDRMIAANLDAYRRFPFLRRIPILGRWPKASERSHRWESVVLGCFLLAMAAISLIDWVVSR